jgi:hypothetical protein
MAIKTFTTGELLTASDTNTYLANAGLVYVTSTTVGSGVSSVTISNCFSSTYDNYKVIWSGGVTSASGSGYIQLSGITTGLYYGALPFYNIAAASYGAAPDSGITFWRYIGGGNATFGSLNADICAPYATKTKTIQAWYTRVGYSGFYTGYCDSIASSTGFTVGNTDWGTMTGGTITVYGYRKA